MRRPSALILLLLSTAALSAQPSTPAANIAAPTEPFAPSHPAIPAAQSPTAPQLSAAQTLAAERHLLTAREAAQSCPVALTVNRKPQGAVVYASLTNAQQQGQALILSLAPTASPIAAADVIVFGYTSGTHIFPATPQAPNEASETFHLTASAEHPLTRSTLQTEHLVAINRIDLTRIQYADGTTWQPSSTSHCAAAPSLLVLINAAR